MFTAGTRGANVLTHRTRRASTAPGRRTRGAVTATTLAAVVGILLSGAGPAVAVTGGGQLDPVNQLLSRLGTGSSMPRTTAPVTYETRIEWEGDGALNVGQTFGSSCLAVNDKESGRKVRPPYSLVNKNYSTSVRTWQVTSDQSKAGCGEGSVTSAIIEMNINQQAAFLLRVDTGRITCGTPKPFCVSRAGVVLILG